MPLCRLAGLALPATLWLTAAVGQGVSPWLERTGRGPYDQYRDTLFCHAVLERALAADPARPEGERIAGSLGYTAGFAAFLLESATVTAADGAILGPERIDPDTEAARAIWDAVLRSEDGAAAAAVELARCLATYGDDS